MATTIRAIYDGKTFVPQEHVDLPKDIEVTITIDEPSAEPDEGRYLFLKAAMSANLQGPPDWSRRLDEYLYHDRAVSETEDE